MRRLLWLLIVVVSTGCATNLPPPATQPAGRVLTQRDLVGTWLYDSAVVAENGQHYLIPVPFFVWFKSDGSCYTWPTPWLRPSQGVYSVRDGELFLDNTRCELGIDGGKLWLKNDEATAFMHRIW